MYFTYDQVFHVPDGIYDFTEALQATPDESRLSYSRRGFSDQTVLISTGELMNDDLQQTVDKIRKLNSR